MNPVPQALKILVVDDSEDAADSLAMLLEFEGHQVAIAHDGLAALDVAARERPDVVILDIGMPGLSGYEVAQRLRAEPWGGEPLLIAATGWGQEEDRRQALAAGFDRHLVKPMDANELAQSLVGWVAARRGSGA